MLLVNFKFLKNQSQTPLSDNLEKTRINLGMPRNAAYGDALNLCKKLEKHLNQLKNK